jgi:hypothetical protein
MPRGRANLLRQVADGRRIHLVASLKVLEQDRTELDQAESRLAPGDDGVDARTVAVVRANATVTVAIERRGVTARPTVPLTRDQIDERRFLGLLHESLFSLTERFQGRVGGAWRYTLNAYWLGGSVGIREGWWGFRQYRS